MTMVQLHKLSCFRHLHQLCLSQEPSLRELKESGVSMKNYSKHHFAPYLKVDIACIFYIFNFYFSF